MTVAGLKVPCYYEQYLEYVLLQIYTIQDRTEMEAYVPSAKESCRFYDPTQFSSLDLKAMAEAYRLKVSMHLYK